STSRAEASAIKRMSTAATTRDRRFTGGVTPSPAPIEQQNVHQNLPPLPDRKSCGGKEEGGCLTPRAQGPQGLCDQRGNSRRVCTVKGQPAGRRQRLPAHTDRLLQLAFRAEDGRQRRIVEVRARRGKLAAV